MYTYCVYYYYVLLSDTSVQEQVTFYLLSVSMATSMFLTLADMNQQDVTHIVHAPSGGAMWDYYIQIECSYLIQPVILSDYFPC